MNTDNIKAGDRVTLEGEPANYTYTITEANGDRFFAKPDQWETGIAPVELIYSHHITNIIK